MQLSGFEVVELASAQTVSAVLHTMVWQLLTRPLSLMRLHGLESLGSSCLNPALIGEQNAPVQNLHCKVAVSPW